jgi:hypothetical protein
MHIELLIWIWIYIYTYCTKCGLTDPKKFSVLEDNRSGYTLGYATGVGTAADGPYRSRRLRAETSNAADARQSTIGDACSGGFVAEPRLQTLCAFKTKNWPYLQQLQSLHNQESSGFYLKAL